MDAQDVMALVTMFATLVSAHAALSSRSKR
jgi:hypothetical protein